MSEWRSFIELLRNSKADVAVLLTTFLLTVIFDLTIAIEVGLLLAVFLFLKRIMDVTEISVLKSSSNKDFDDSVHLNKEKLEIQKGIEVYEINGPFFFGIANKFEESMRIIGEKPIVRIIRMRKVPFIDSTGLHNLESILLKAKKEKIHIILSGVNENIKESFEKFHFIDTIGRENICENIQIALQKANLFVDQNKNAETDKTQ